MKSRHYFVLEQIYYWNAAGKILQNYLAGRMAELDVNVRRIVMLAAMRRKSEKPWMILIRMLIRYY